MTNAAASMAWQFPISLPLLTHYLCLSLTLNEGRIQMSEEEEEGEEEDR